MPSTSSIDALQGILIFKTFKMMRYNHNTCCLDYLRHDADLLLQVSFIKYSFCLTALNITGISIYMAILTFKMRI